MLINGQTLARHWQNAKKVMGDGWNHAVRIGHGLDHSMRMGKKLLAAAVPILDQMGASHHVPKLMGGIHAYDQGKADVMHGVNNVQTHLHRIKRQVPEIDL